MPLSANPGERPHVTPLHGLAEWLLPALVLAPTILLPLARDQGVFAYGGQVILGGGLPYRDFIDQKGPATHYTFALAIGLFGATALGVRLFFFVVMLVGSWLAAEVADRLGGIESRLPAALAYALVSLHAPRDAAWMSAQVEDILLPLFLGVILLLGSTEAVGSRARHFLAGLLLGLACLYKPTALVTAGGIAVVACWLSCRRVGLRGAVKACRTGAWAICGFVFLPTVTLAYLAAQPGWLTEFWAVQEFNSSYAHIRDGSWWEGVRIFSTQWGKLVPLAIWGLILTRQRGNVYWQLFWAVLGTAALVIVLQWKFPIIYQWTPLAGCLAILAGVGLGQVLHWVRSQVADRRLASVAASTASAGLLLILAPVEAGSVLSMWADGLQVALGERSVEAFRAPCFIGAGVASDQDKAVAYVCQHTEPKDSVLVWGYEPAINFLSGRRSPSRFMVERWLTIPGVPRQSEWRNEFIGSLQAKPPLYVLVVNDNNRPYYVPNPVDAVAEFPAFEAFLRRHYDLEAEVAGIFFYRRLPAELAQVEN
jgi:hypothetical protein